MLLSNQLLVEVVSLQSNLVLNLVLYHFYRQTFVRVEALRTFHVLMRLLHLVIEGLAGTLAADDVLVAVYLVLIDGTVETLASPDVMLLLLGEVVLLAEVLWLELLPVEVWTEILLLNLVV